MLISNNKSRRPPAPSRLPRRQAAHEILSATGRRRNTRRRTARRLRGFRACHQMRRRRATIRVKSTGVFSPCATIRPDNASFHGKSGCCSQGRELPRPCKLPSSLKRSSAEVNPLFATSGTASKRITRTCGSKCSTGFPTSSKCRQACCA